MESKSARIHVRFAGIQALSSTIRSVNVTLIAIHVTGILMSVETKLCLLKIKQKLFASCMAHQDWMYKTKNCYHFQVPLLLFNEYEGTKPSSFFGRNSSFIHSLFLTTLFPVSMFLGKCIGEMFLKVKTCLKLTAGRSPIFWQRDSLETVKSVWWTIKR